MRPIQIMKALSDETRLRITGILDGYSLSVNEITEVLGMGQSRISRHLKILADAGILESRRDGVHIYYNIARNRNEILEGIFSAFGLGNLAGKINSENGKSITVSNRLLLEEDLMKLAGVLEERKRVTLEHFQKYGDYEEKQESTWADPLFYRNKIKEMIPDKLVSSADIGCGSGELAGAILDKIEKIILIDQSPNMLERARFNIQSEKAEFRIGSLEHLPLREGEVDLAIFSMVLHHIPDVMGALEEASRVLRPGGRLIVAELKKHSFEEMRERFADFYLGFDASVLESYLKQNGFTVESKSSGKGQGKLECVFYAAIKN